MKRAAAKGVLWSGVCHGGWVPPFLSISWRYASYWNVLLLQLRLFIAVGGA